MTGVWRDKNGTPLTRVKQLAPGKSKEQLSQEQFAFSHRRKMIEQDKAQYQAEQRHRPTYGRDMMTGKKMKPRKVGQCGHGDMAITVLQCINELYDPTKVSKMTGVEVPWAGTRTPVKRK